MQEGYECFIEDFRQRLLEATGFGADRIYYKKKEEYPVTPGDRLFIKRREAGEIAEICALYISDLYEEYCQGAEIDELLGDVMKRLESFSRTDIAKNVKLLNDYEKIKKELFIRLVNVQRNKSDLEDAVCRVLGDIAMVLYVKMGEMEHYMTSMKIKRHMIKNWNREEDEIFKEALLNTYFISPPRIYCWEKMIFDPRYDGENFMNILADYPIRKDAIGNCLSTVRRTNGAVAVFLPGVAERLANLFQGSFYLVFTSIHEVMIHNAATAKPEDLRRVLEDTVRDTTPEEDFLTLNIYFYDRDTGQFSLCQTQEAEEA
jgi:hypothetical protein